jgi:hypothetical protein
VDVYVIQRRSGWANTDELGAAAERSKAVADADFQGHISWIRSYVVPEADGRLGTVCIYEASSPEKIHEHAKAADLPVTEIKKSISTVVMRDDPAT